MSLDEYEDLYQIIISEYKAESIDELIVDYFKEISENMGGDIDLSLTVSDGYLTEIVVSAVDPYGGKAKVKLEIDEINKLNPDKRKVDQFIKNTKDEQY